MLKFFENFQMSVASSKQRNFDPIKIKILE